MTDQDGPAASNDDLPRGFGFWTGLFVIVASMVGVGILTSSGFTIKETESYSTLFLLWTVGGVMALSGALTIAEVSTAMPRVGGEYVFVHKAFGPATAFVFGWATLVVGFAGPTALIAHASVTYLLRPWTRGLAAGGMADWITPIAATIAIIVFTWVHCMGQKQSSLVQNSITTFKILMLVGLVAAGFLIGTGDWRHVSAGKSLASQSAGVLAVQLAYVMYSYSGWNATVYLAGEIRNPPKLLPRCLISGCLAVTLLYLLMNLVYAYALDPAYIAGLDWGEIEPIAEIAAERLFGKGISNPLAILIGLGVLASVSAYLLIGPRVSFAMARDSLFPRYAGIAHPTRHTPAAATITQAVVALTLLWGSQILAGDAKAFKQLLDYTSAGLFALTGLTVGCIFLLRRHSDYQPTFRTPIYPLPPLFFIVMTVWAIVFFTHKQPIPSTLSFASMLAGYPLYYFFCRQKARAA